MFCVFQNTSDNQIDKNFILAQQLAVYVVCTLYGQYSIVICDCSKVHHCKITVTF